MSDKDFDALFSSKLADMEVTPSSAVWNNITDELDNKSFGKKYSDNWMRIAAGIIMIMGISLLFIRPRSEKIGLHGSYAEVKPKADVAINDADLPTDYTTETQEQAYVAPVHVKHQNVFRVQKHPKSIGTNSADSSGSVANTTADYASVPKVMAPQPDISVSGLDTLKAVDAGAVAKPARYAVTKTPIAKNTIAPAPKKHKIHSLGDLLNIVIAKVDKREDKIIEFTNTSDDDSFNVTGINLGIVKAKRQN